MSEELSVLVYEHRERVKRNKLIIADRMAGMTYAAIARKYGISAQTCRVVTYRKAHKDIRENKPVEEVIKYIGSRSKYIKELLEMNKKEI